MKCGHVYTGPCLVVKVINPLNYQIQKTKRGVPEVVHVDKLKRFNGEPPVGWNLPDEPPGELVTMPDQLGNDDDVAEPNQMEATEVGGVLDDAEVEGRSRDLPETEAAPSTHKDNRRRRNLEEARLPIIDEEEEDPAEPSRPTRKTRTPARFEDFIMSAFREVQPFEGEELILTGLFEEEQRSDDGPINRRLRCDSEEVAV